MRWAIPSARLTKPETLRFLPNLSPIYDHNSPACCPLKALKNLCLGQGGGACLLFFLFPNDSVLLPQSLNIPTFTSFIITFFYLFSLSHRCHVLPSMANTVCKSHQALELWSALWDFLCKNSCKIL